jgi:hypothetical protein
MLRSAVLLLLLSACASSPRDPARDAYPESERGREAVERMQQEFNALFPDA